MSHIVDAIIGLKSSLPEDVTLVAVSKYHSAAEIQEAYEVGQRVFGENIVQELCQKQPVLPQDIQWHFIGHLQRNKAKYIAPFVQLIHSVDSFELLKEIDKQGKRCHRVIPCLLQIHVADEESKFGFLPQECLQMLALMEWKTLSNVSIRGIMGIATNTDSKGQIRNEFQLLGQIFKEVKENFFQSDEQFSVCSWGMSGDYPIAVEEGSNMVRIGSMIFGERVYKK